jgi:hypothetical protein
LKTYISNLDWKRCTIPLSKFIQLGQWHKLKLLILTTFIISTKRFFFSSKDFQLNFLNKNSITQQTTKISPNPQTYVDVCMHSTPIWIKVKYPIICPHYFFENSWKLGKKKRINIVYLLKESYMWGGYYGPTLLFEDKNVI